MQQPALAAFKIKLLLFDGPEQPLEARFEERFFLVNGNAIAQVEPLDAADGERRLTLHHHGG